MSLDYVSIVAEQSARMAELLRAGPLDAAVPGTPEWNLGELGVHMVDVQRWATLIVETGERGEPDEPLPDVSEVAAALDASSARLCEVLAAAEPDAPCWNFTTNTPHTMAFWPRRQANEVAMHRWDAASATQADPAPIATAVAVDVIDEFVHVMLQRVADRTGVDLQQLTDDVHLHCTDTADLGLHGEWTFEVRDGAIVVTDEHRKSAVAIRGAASDLALFLFNRGDRTRVETFGDDQALARWAPVFRF